MRGFRQLIKEERAACGEAVEHGFGPPARKSRVARRRERHPKRRPATIDESDRRRSDRRRIARTPVDGGGRRQSGPGRSSGQALGVEPRRLVAFQASRQDLGFPRSGRRFEAFERRQHGWKRVRPLKTRLFRHVLPGEQEAEEVARGDGIDLRPQPSDRVMMDAGKQATVAPLLVVDARKEASAAKSRLRFPARSARRPLPTQVRAAPSASFA